MPDLQPFDVLLYRGTSIVSRATQVFDDSEISHTGLYLGENGVAEAIGEGLVMRPLPKSVAGAEWVRHSRLKTDPNEYARVGKVVEFYLSQGNRYAYEQIVLLAALVLIRRTTKNFFWKRAVRNVLDRAAIFVTNLLQGGKQPMICSEFIHRSFNEAVPNNPLDPYAIRVLRESEPLGSRGEPTLLDRFSGAVTLTGLAGPAYWAETMRSADVRTDVSDAETQAALEEYLDALGESTALDPLEDDPVDQETLVSVDHFLGALATATSAAAGATAATPLRLSERENSTAALARVRLVLSDFVTPREIQDSPNLRHVGRVHP